MWRVKGHSNGNKTTHQSNVAFHFVALPRAAGAVGHERVGLVKVLFQRGERQRHVVVVEHEPLPGQHVGLQQGEVVLRFAKNILNKKEGIKNKVVT